MNIKLKDVKFLCEFLLAELEKSNLKNIAMYVDYYWTVSLDDAYDFSIASPNLSVGSLVEDWEWLAKVLSRVNPVTTVDFERLGALIKAIGIESNRATDIENSSVSIAVTDLKRLCDFMLTKAAVSGFVEIEIKIDRYWHIEVADAYDMQHSPSALTGSLVSDWENLEQLLTKGRQPMAVDFERLGRVIAVIGNDIAHGNPDDQKQINWFINVCRA